MNYVHVSACPADDVFMNRKILYYAVGPVHPRNMELIASGMPDHDFSMVYEPTARWMTRKFLDQFRFPKIALVGGKVPETGMPNPIDAVVLSTVQARPAPMNLLAWIIQRNLRAIAVQESNQIALNHGSVNNYLLPVDNVLVASPHERAGLIRDGVEPERISVTGWPFCGDDTHADLSDASVARSDLGLDPSKPVAVLTLAGFNIMAGETPAVRRRLLEVASRGLPRGYQLAVKPHPIERMSELMPFVKKYAPRAVVIDGSTPIQNVLAATDVVLNRGVSQVAIEALVREIPVIVIATDGKTTPFHDLAPDVVIESSDALGSLIGRILDDPNHLSLYRDFLAEHVPYSFEEARRRTCDVISALSCHGPETKRGQRLDLALYRSWQGDRRGAMELLTGESDDTLQDSVEAMRQVVSLQGDRRALAVLRQRYAGGYSESVLKCLWINNLRASRAGLVADDLEWMRDFPTRTNFTLFCQHSFVWMQILYRERRFGELDAFEANLSTESADVPEVTEILTDMARLRRGTRGVVQYHIGRKARFAGKVARFLKERAN